MKEIKEAFRHSYLYGDLRKTVDHWLADVAGLEVFEQFANGEPDGWVIMRTNGLYLEPRHEFQSIAHAYEEALKYAYTQIQSDAT